MKSPVVSLNLQRTSVCRHLCAMWVLGWMLAFANPVDAQPKTSVAKQAEGTTSKIIVQGEIIGEIRHKGASDFYLAGGRKLLTIRTEGSAALRFPRTITTVASLEGRHLDYRYTELTPPLPIKLEGMEGNSTADRQRIEDYFRKLGIETRPLEIRQRFEEVTGRSLLRWYEVSGLVERGTASLDGTVTATFHTEYQKLPDGAFKEHHRGHSLELLDVLVANPPGTDSDLTSIALNAYRCGCQGFSESTPLTTINGKGFSVDIRRLGARGGRLPKEYLINDHFGTQIFRLSVEFLQPNMEHIRYDFFKGNAPAAFAIVNHTRTADDRAEITIESSLEQSELLDTLDLYLKAMPTQIIRGDGIRDSTLGEVEKAVDEIRFFVQSDWGVAADIVSAIDVYTLPTERLKGLFGMTNPNYPEATITAPHH